ncbi:hypothetical protein [Mesorhizobium sp. BR1-1-2]|uniref:hypothetical protein n=1 Tax=Mesorhizobium sp. BR1-1-2 TaxID=2876652 RepID=UPI001CCEDA54|nr:hypothetical protein [Mesorhizobium sp. BR1-1-2]MBZ9965902.1 hypothetical protein [Mesorhizobium sp. BR1-1-2]
MIFVSGTDRAIQRHRKRLRLVTKLTAARQRCGGSLYRVIAIDLASAGAILAEKIAWRRLIRQRPANVHQARDKAMYLIGLSLSGRATLSGRDIAEIRTRSKGFENSLKALLQKQPCPPDGRQGPDGSGSQTGDSSLAEIGDQDRARSVARQS